MTQKTFDNAVSKMRTAITQRIKRNGKVSSADLTNVATNITGRIRSAVISTAFNRMIGEKQIKRTKNTVRNTITRNDVSVYTNK